MQIEGQPLRNKQHSTVRSNDFLCQYFLSQRSLLLMETSSFRVKALSSRVFSVVITRAGH